MAIASINPATGEKIREFSPFDDAEIEKRLSRAEKAFRNYRRTTLADRAELLHAASELLFQEKQAFAELITLEMGKLFRDSLAEIEKCARGCRFYAENGARFLEEEPAQTDAAESYVQYQPLGPVLAIMPWNFPFWQVFRFAAPALIAGNVGLLKHASNVSQCALAIEEIFCRAGFEDGVFQTLLIEPEQVEKLIVDARVKAVTVTGSEKAGAAVASAAAREIKKSVLELGGSDAFIVMPSADFESALSTAVKARTINTGQSCIAAKRFIIADEIYEQFLQQFVERMRALKVGDPMDPETELGPLTTEQILRGVDDQVQKTIAARRKIVNGWKPNSRSGIFLRAHGSRRCAERIAGVPRRNLRPGCSYFPRGKCRRGRRARERYHIRSGFERLDQRSQGAKTFRIGVGQRNGFHQRDGRVRSAFAIRRCETFRLWPRTRRRGSSRVHKYEDDLDFLRSGSERFTNSRKRHRRRSDRRQDGKSLDSVRCARRRSHR